MKKTEMVDTIATRGEITKSAASKAADAMFAIISEQLGRGEKIALPGFGTFSVVTRKARSGWNPATRERMEIPASNAVKFTAALPLRERLKEPARKVGPGRNSPMPARKTA